MATYPRKLFTVFFGLAVIGSIECRAQDKNHWAINISQENDALSLNDKRENYTSSVRVEVLTSAVKLPNLLFPRLKSTIPFEISRFAVGAYGFTPQNIVRTDTELDDRPYGSFAYLSTGTASYDLIREITLKTEVRVGLLGTDVVSNVQQAMNPLFGRSKPMGWDNQIMSGKSFAVNYSAVVTKSSFHSGQIFLKHFLNNIHLEHDSLANDDSEFVTIDSLMGDKTVMRELSELLVAEAGFEFLQTNLLAGVNVGMVEDNVFAGIELNLFNFNRHSLFNYIPEHVIAYGPLHQTHHMRESRDMVRFNVFVRPTVKAVGYNALLEGAMFNDNSAVVVPHGDIQRILFEVQAGFNLLIAHQFTIAAHWSGRSKEYADGRPFNSWGGITLGYSPSKWHE